MLTVHHLRLSQSERIVWLCEELELNYELKLYDRRSDNGAAPDEYKALHPNGTSPIVTDGDLALAESGAIVNYISGKHASWRRTPGPDDKSFAQHQYWFNFANGSFVANFMMDFAAREAGGTAPEFVHDRAQRAWQQIEDQLAETPFFGGANLTTADIMMVFPLTTMRLFGTETLEDRPKTLAYLKRIGERPAYRRAMEKAEPGFEPNLA